MADQGQGQGYSWQIMHRPSYATLDVRLGPGGSVTAEAGAMISHTSGVTPTTKLNGGCMAALMKPFTKESLFVTTYASQQGGSVSLAPTLPGDIAHIPITGVAQKVAAGAYLAHGAGVEVATSFGGCRSLFGGSGLFVLEAVGQGDLWVTGFGSISEMHVDGSLAVDTGHIIAWDNGLAYTIRRVGGWKSTLLSGEGLVVEFQGKGRVLVSSRNLSAFVQWLTPWLPR